MQTDADSQPIQPGDDHFVPGCVRDFKVRGQWVTARFERYINPSSIRVRGLKTLRLYELTLRPGVVRAARAASAPKPRGDEHLPVCLRLPARPKRPTKASKRRASR